MDTSKNVGKDDLDAIKNLIIQQGKVYSLSKDGVRAAVISYGATAKNVLQINKGISLTALRTALNQLKQTSESRRPEEALRRVKDIIVNNKDEVRQYAGKVAILIISGSKATSDINLLSSEARALYRAGVNIAVILIGSDLQKEDLKSILARPDSIVDVTSSDQLSDVTSAISDTVHSTARLEKPLDLVFIIGTKGSNALADFVIGKDTIKGILERLEISKDKIRIGLIVYGQGTRLPIRLDGDYSRDGAVGIVDQLSHLGQGSALSEAIDISRVYTFNELYGGRKAVPKSAVILTNENMNQKARLAAERLKERGVRVIGAAIGTTGDMESMKDITSTGDEAFAIRNRDDVKENVKEILTRLMPGIHGLFYIHLL